MLMDKLQGLAFRPRLIRSGEADAFIERGVRVEPEFDEGIRVGVRQVFLAQDLERARLRGIGVGDHAVSHFEAELIGLMLIVP